MVEAGKQKDEDSDQSLLKEAWESVVKPAFMLGTAVAVLFFGLNRGSDKDFCPFCFGPSYHAWNEARKDGMCDSCRLGRQEGLYWSHLS